MIAAYRTLLAAVLLLAACCATPALATPAILHSDATVHEGPGDEYIVLWQLVAGTHVDVRECRQDEWCRVIRRSKQGWLKFEHLDLHPGVGGTDTPVSSTNGGSKGGSRQNPADKSDDGKGRFAAAPKPGGAGGNTGTDPGASAASEAVLAGAVDLGGAGNDNPSGPTFSTLSGDTPTTIGQAVVAASCPRCR